MANHTQIYRDVRLVRSAKRIYHVSKGIGVLTVIGAAILIGLDMIGLMKRLKA